MDVFLKLCFSSIYIKFFINFMPHTLKSQFNNKIPIAGALLCLLEKDNEPPVIEFRKRKGFSHNFREPLTLHRNEGIHK